MYLRSLSVLSRYLLFTFPSALLPVGLLLRPIRRPFELFPDGEPPILASVQDTPGLFRKAAGDGVGLFCLEQQQIFALFHGPYGVVHAPAPGHPVKLPGVAG